MALRLYTLLLWLLSPLFLLAGWRRCRHAARRGLHVPRCLSARFGSVPDDWQPGGIWLHAVSMGETRSIFPLLTALHARWPHLPLTLTNGSTQGLEQSRQFDAVPLQSGFIPYDYPFAVRRFLRQLRPRLVIMVETEIWPNLYAECHRQRIPLLLINARLKEASFQRYRRWVGPLIRNSLQRLTVLCAQFPVDAERFQALGAPPERVKICGNLKFDMDIPPELKERAATLRQQPGLNRTFIWCAGSTHAGEEESVLAAHAKLRTVFPDALLILVPRHADRFDAVDRLLAARQISHQRVSQNEPVHTDTAVLLGDTVGELLKWYAVSDAAFVGGTLVPFGGHNILEPAALSRPVLSGPHTGNLQALYDAMAQCGGVHFVTDADSLAQALIHWARQPVARRQAGEQAHQCFRRQQGALQQHLNIIERCLRAETPSDPSHSCRSARF